MYLRYWEAIPVSRSWSMILCKRYFTLIFTILCICLHIIFLSLSLLGFWSGPQPSLPLLPSPFLFFWLSQFSPQQCPHCWVGGWCQGLGTQTRGKIYWDILDSSITDHMLISFGVFWPRRHGNIEILRCHCSRRIIMSLDVLCWFGHWIIQCGAVICFIGVMILRCFS